MNCYKLLFLFVIVFSSCGHESNLITGQVTSESGKTLKNVLIQVNGTDLYSKSERDGHFLINTKQRGNELLINKEGYQIQFVNTDTISTDVLKIKLVRN